MPERNLIESCSPTLAGIKTANLVNVKYESREQAMEDIREMNRVFRKKGIRVVPLKFGRERTLLYIYRPAYLERDMKDADAEKLLTSLSYPCGSSGMCVAHLAERFKTSDEFPHEIGVFLGYPSEDVLGFIRHKDTGCKLVGTWKVYGDVEKAKKKFAQFQKCRNIYRDRHASGRSIEDLTVCSRKVV